jgi:hypothetical protein
MWMTRDTLWLLNKGAEVRKTRDGCIIELQLLDNPIVFLYGIFQSRTKRLKQHHDRRSPDAPALDLLDAGEASAAITDLLLVEPDILPCKNKAVLYGLITHAGLGTVHILS